MTEESAAGGDAPAVHVPPGTWPVACLVIGGYAIGTALMWIAFGYSDRHPLDGVLLELCFVAMNIAVGFLLRHWAALSLTVVALGVGVGAGLLFGDRTTADDDPIGDVFLFILILVTVPLLIAIGVAIGKAITSPQSPLVRALQVVAFACLVLMALPLAEEIYEHDRVVRADRAHPAVLNERSGFFDGIPLGASRNEVVATLGPNKQPEPEPNRHGRIHLYFLDYPETSISMVNGGLNEVYTTDPEAETARGVGIGDSLSLAKDAYPGLKCHEGSEDSDFLDPYPRCWIDLPHGLTLEFDATYDEPGVPITGLSFYKDVQYFH